MAPSSAPAFRVEVLRSSRRKKTVGAQLAGDLLKVTVPSWMTEADVDKWVAEMARRFGRQHRTERIDLKTRADGLADRFNLPKPKEIRWVDNMTSRWGSCTYRDGAIRISSRLAGDPDWVIDAVIMHEMCHLIVPDHSPRFWRLMEQYPLHERATGYLIARARDSDELPPLSTDSTTDSTTLVG